MPATLTVRVARVTGTECGIAPNARMMPDSRMTVTARVPTTWNRQDRASSVVPTVRANRKPTPPMASTASGAATPYGSASPARKPTST